MVLTEADRLEDYFAPNKLKCDWQLMSGWYRFMGGAGIQMANKCMKTGSTACSAIGAGWIVGSLPTVEKGIETRGVCFRTPGSCCSSTMDIKVRNCGNYIVYYLEGPERCPYRYCSTKGIVKSNGRAEKLYLFHWTFETNISNVKIICIRWFWK